ncbi:hypothetical protein [Streptosporangium sp. NPDC003464]
MTVLAIDIGGPRWQAVAKQAGLGFLRRLTVSPTSLERDAGLYGAAALALTAAAPDLSRQKGPLG